MGLKVGGDAIVSRFRLWWQQIRKYWVVTTIIALVAMGVMIFLGYWFKWDWTGFNGYTQVTTAHTTSGPSAGTVVRTEVYQPGKALWDWLQLLIIPVVLAVGALLFNLATTRTEQKIATQRYEQDQQIAKQRYEHDQRIALDKQREDLLQTYLDRMSELLLKEKLLSSAVDAEVRNVARTCTISVLRQLDAGRVGDVFTFLCEAGLMETPEPIVRLGDANLSKVNWREADLTDANLSVADLSGADLRNAFLAGADLRNAFLAGADLRNAHVRGANLSGADLTEADLTGAILIDADLRAADLTEANLRGAILEGANLSQANLSGANLIGAKSITIEELEKRANSLEGATMPDGSKHP